MECYRCLMSDDIEGVKITGKQCCICDAHDKHAAAPKDLHGMLDQLRYDGRGRQFDAILGISGGLDSTYLAALAYETGLRTLLVHFDNGYNTDIAEQNIRRLTEATNFPLLRFRPDTKIYNLICMRLLLAGLPDADIANDLGMAKYTLDCAKRFDVRWVLNGHNYQYEGWNPIGWTYMDGRYLQSITKHAVPAYMHWGLWEQLFSGVKHARPFYQYEHLNKEVMEGHARRVCGWESYGPKHCENVYTEWVTSCWLPPMGIDKRRNYLSADIRCGRETKESARAKLTPPEFSGERLRVAEGLGFHSVQAFEEYLRVIPRSTDRSVYASYRGMLRRLKPVMWLAAKCDLIPEAFYRKYVKG